jgi:hypothetical protein
MNCSNGFTVLEPTRFQWMIVKQKRRLTKFHGRWALNLNAQMNGFNISRSMET